MLEIIDRESGRMEPSIKPVATDEFHILPIIPMEESSEEQEGQLNLSIEDMEAIIKETEKKIKEHKALTEAEPSHSRCITIPNSRPKLYSNSRVKVAVQNLYDADMNQRLLFDSDLKQALSKRLRQMNITPIDYLESPYFKLWFIYFLNFLCHGFFGTMILCMPPYEKLWQRLLSFMVFIVFIFVARKIIFHKRRTEELKFSWLKDLEKNSIMVSQLSKLETDKERKITKEENQACGSIFFFLMISFFIITAVLTYNVYPDKDQLTFIPVPLFLAITSGVSGKFFTETDTKRRWRIAITHSIVTAFLSWSFVYVMISKLWPFSFSLLLTGVSLVVPFTIGTLDYCMFSAKIQADEKLFKFAGEETQELSYNYLLGFSEREEAIKS